MSPSTVVLSLSFHDDDDSPSSSFLNSRLLSPLPRSSPSVEVTGIAAHSCASRRDLMIMMDLMVIDSVC